MQVRKLYVYGIAMMKPDDRITTNPLQCGGRPCIRDMRIRVTDILDLLASGLNFDQILEELPDLEREDIVAAITYASRGIDHPVIAA
jgi:uncharacterized protein (DUF433 family)